MVKGDTPAQNKIKKKSLKNYVVCNVLIMKYVIGLILMIKHLMNGAGQHMGLHFPRYSR